MHFKKYLLAWKHVNISQIPTINELLPWLMLSPSCQKCEHSGAMMTCQNTELDGLVLFKRQWWQLFIRSVASNSLQHHGRQHARLPCPLSPSSVCSSSYPLTQWCHPTVLSSSCLQTLPTSGSFPMSQFFTSWAKGLELQFQHQSFQWIFRTDFL